MKISKDKLKDIIKEEALKQIKVMELNEKKETILKELYEMGYDKFSEPEEEVAMEECGEMEMGEMGDMVDMGNPDEEFGEELSEEYIEEILGFSKAEKEAKLKEKYGEALKAILGHPNLKKTYGEYKSKNPEVAKKMVIFKMENPNVKYFQYDSAKGEFAAKGVYSVASGEGLSGK